MPLSGNELAAAVAELRKAREAEQSRLTRIASWLGDEVTGDAAGVHVPRKATREFNLLVEQARFNVLPLVTTAVVQNLYVEGFRPTGPSGRAPSTDNAPIWDSVWQPNRMDARQAGLYRAAVEYGVSYAVVLPGEPGPVITPMSPRKLTALYVDPVNDEWPELAMEVDHVAVVDNRKVATVRVLDDAMEYTLEIQDEKFPRLVADPGEHGLGVTPVVRYLDRYDLAGPAGKIEPLIPIQQQLNQTTFGLLMAQQFGAFRQRWATGMAIAEDANGNPIEPFNAAVNTLWQNESTDGRFGEFGQTDLGGYLNSRDKLLLHVASVAQIPPHNLLVGAGISNISAEALAALEAGHRQDIAEHQTSFGESHEQLFRLAGRAADDDEAWNDTSAQVVWRDTTPRSLAQIADALGKLAQMLGIPVRALWERIPGVTDQDIARWEAMAAEADLMDELTRMVEAETAPTPPETAPPANGDGVEPAADTLT